MIQEFTQEMSKTDANNLQEKSPDAQKRFWRKLLCLLGKHETGIFCTSRHGMFLAGLRCIHCGRITWSKQVSHEEIDMDGEDVY